MPYLHRIEYAVLSMNRPRCRDCSSAHDVVIIETYWFLLVAFISSSMLLVVRPEA